MESTAVPDHDPTPRSGQARVTTVVAHLGFPVLFIVAGIWRAVLVASNPEVAIPGWGTALVVLRSDAPLLAALCASLWLAGRVRNRWIACALRGFLACSVLVYVADVIVIQLMNTRLSWGRFITYAPQPRIVMGAFSDRVGWLAAWGIVVGLTSSTAFMCRPQRLQDRWSRLGLSAGLVVGAGLVVWPRTDERVPRWMRENLLEMHAPNPERKLYSLAQAERLLTQFHQANAPRKITGVRERRNVLLLLLESWSCYQSRAFGGHLDWTPLLDDLARRHVRYTRFHAGSWCTGDALANILGGVRLGLDFSGRELSGGIYRRGDGGHSLYEVFGRAGYKTAFLTTGPLEFTDKGNWLRRIGCDEVEGDESPFYLDWPKFSFGSAPDEALYRRALEWINSMDSRPWFLTLETVSTHMPYLDPATEEPDMEAAFRYADRWATWFVSELERSGFFDNGILIITGDHRSMSPLFPIENQLFGLGCASRVPFVLLDSRFPEARENAGFFKQSDMVASFEQWLGSEAKIGALDSSVFEVAANPNAVALHRRGNERGVVDVLCPEGEGKVHVAGDRTDFVWHRNLSPERRAAVLAMIAHERLMNSGELPESLQAARDAAADQVLH